MATLIGVGLVLRGVLIATTAGTSDLGLWEWFAMAFQTYGPAEAYVQVSGLNHPPLAIWLVSALEAAGPLRVMLRGSQVIADIATSFLLIAIARRTGFDPRLAATLFFLSPVAILTSSLHTNTDSLVATICCAVVLLMLDGRHAAAGAMLGVAISIKVVALLPLPLLLLASGARGRTRFSIACAAVVMAACLPVLAAEPAAFIRNVMAYGGSGAAWGLALPLQTMGAIAKALEWWDVRAWSYSAADAYAEAARIFVIASIAVVTLAWSRTRSILELPAAVALVFLASVTVAPRVTQGYFIWFLPLLMFAVRPVLAVTVYAAASLQLVVNYTLYAQGFRWTLIDLSNMSQPWWVPRAVTVVGAPLLLLSAIALVTGLRQIVRAPSLAGRPAEERAAAQRGGGWTK